MRRERLTTWALVLAAIATGLALAWSQVAFSDPSKDDPAVIEAEVIEHNKTRNSLSAEGKVTVVQGDRALSADRIEFLPREDRVTATGSVRLLEASGALIQADSAEFTTDLKQAKALNFGVRLKDGSRLVGSEVNRSSGLKTLLTRGSFTPCKPCAEDPTRSPTWRLRAREVTHDETTKDIEYEDVTLDVFGVPLTYLPYFRHPDPTVDRRSGWLTPSLFFGGEFDTVAKVPYYWNIAPDKDLTLQPFFTAKSAPVMAAEYRQLLDKGKIRIDGSLGALNRTSNDGIQKNENLRGHAYLDGDFALDEIWRLSLQGRFTSDDSYLQTFKIDDAGVLRNTVALEGFWREAYVRIGAYGIQDLRENTSQNDTPFALPEIEGSWQSEPTSLGNAFIEGHARALGREEGADGQSISAVSGWRLPIKTSSGHRFDFEASLRGDAYNTIDGEAVGASGDSTSLRGTPRFVAGWRYPLIQWNTWGALILEPRIQTVLALDENGDPDIPNENARAIEFDESNFYKPDRFPGYDRLDDGQRVDYGVTATTLFANEGRASAFIGQSLSRKPGDFAEAAAMSGNSSDIVTALNASPSEFLDLTWRTRLRKDSLGLRRNEITIGGGPEWLKGFVSYVETETETQGPEVSSATEQIQLGLGIKLNDYWRLNARHQRNLQDDEPLLWSAGIGYQDECISIDLGFARDFASRADGGGKADSVFLRVNFKYLGGVGLSQGLNSRDTPTR